MLSIENCAVMIVDVQGKLAELMHEKQTLFTNLERLIRGSRLLELPLVVVEQNPAKLGPTIDRLAHLIKDVPKWRKMTFSAMQQSDIRAAVAAANRSDWLVAGIEAHICVYQTARNLVESGYGVHLVADAVSSREVSNKTIALEALRKSGVHLTSVEMALFELMATCEHHAFRDLQQIIK